MRLKLYRGKFYAVWRENGETKRVALRTADRAVAERRLIDQQKKPTGDTINDIVENYLKSKESKPSHEAMRYSWQALKPHFGNLRPDQITTERCKAYAKSRKVSAGTIIKDLGMLRTAVKGKGGEFWFPPAPLPRDRYLTRDEFRSLLEATSLPHLRLFLILALTTGGRSGAILGLTWDRVDFARGRIKLADGKIGGKGRATVPITDEALAHLKMAYEGRTSNHVIEWAGRPVRSVKRAFREAVARAGLEAVTPHVLRHTAAVWMIEDGATIAEVSQYLGHTDTRTTYRVYARHSPDHLRKVAKALRF